MCNKFLKNRQCSEGLKSPPEADSIDNLNTYTTQCDDSQNQKKKAVERKIILAGDSGPGFADEPQLVQVKAYARPRLKNHEVFSGFEWFGGFSSVKRFKELHHKSTIVGIQGGLNDSKKSINGTSIGILHVLIMQILAEKIIRCASLPCKDYCGTT